MRWFSLFVVSLAWACSDAVADNAGEMPRIDVDSGASDGGQRDSRQDEYTIPLRVLRQGGYPSRLYVPVSRDGVDGHFMVDTGSQLTFVTIPSSGPEYLKDAGTVILGGRTTHVVGRRIALEEKYEGLPTLGILGNDILLANPWLFDLPSGQLVAQKDTARFEQWPNVSFENVKDYLYTRLTVDGTPLRMAFDTGAFGLLWVGQAGRPGDAIGETSDAYGNKIQLFFSNGDVTLGTFHRPGVPVVRTPAFPSFEDSNKRVGGQIDGLVGLSTIGDRKFVIDGSRLRISFEP